MIKEIGLNGRMDVAYFNPNPIKVSRAEASREDSVTKAFVELRDVGYPGCTYSLAYDPQGDRLVGVYFQAAVRKTFDVAFERLQ